MMIETLMAWKTILLVLTLLHQQLVLSHDFLQIGLEVAMQA